MPAKKRISAVFGVLCLILLFIFLIFSSTASKEAHRGIELCFNAVIPTLFPVFVLNGILLRLGIADRISRPLRKPLRSIFGISESCAYPLFVGLLSGAPSGIVSLSALCEKQRINKRDASVISALCSPVSFAFLSGTVGGKMLCDVKRGAALFAIQLVSLFTVAFFLSRAVKAEHSIITRLSIPRMTPSDAFTEALGEALNSTLSVCGAVIFFSAVSGVICAIPDIPIVVKALIASFLEMTSGASVICTELSPDTAFLFMCAATGWSGISIICQCASAAKGRFTLAYLILSKLICSVMCLASGHALLMLGIV